METAAKILVVDAEPESLAVIKESLRETYLVEGVAAGLTALKSAAQFRPDLIILDILLPDISGYEVCRRIRRGADLTGVMMVLISGQSTLAERLRCYDAGADDFLAKPFSAAELLAKIRVLIRLKRAADKLLGLNSDLEKKVTARTKQLLEAERLAMIGRHTAGIVHDLNNSLAGIFGIVELITEESTSHPKLKQLMAVAEQMKSMIRNLMAASRGERDLKQEPVSLNRVLQAQVSLLQADPFCKNRVQWIMDLDEVAPVFGIAHHFAQSFGNLLKNATDALFDAPQKRVTIVTRERNGQVEVAISDSGCGMSAHELDNLYEPFFTTKPSVNEGGGPVGTGLGLVSCKQIIESYGGEISVDSAPGKGSTFTVRLPIMTTAMA